MSYLWSMFDLFKRIVKGGPAAQSAADALDPKLAATALLVAIAHSDHDYADVERERIRVAVGDLFLLDPSDSAALQMKAEEAFDASVDYHRFARTVKMAYDQAERGAFFEAAWRVALADGKRDPHEDALMRRLAGLLGVEDRLSVLGRQRAEAREE